MELLNILIETAKLFFGVALLVAITSWVSGVIVLAGVDIIRANPLKWLSTTLWKSGVLVTLFCLYLGLSWQ